MFYFQPCEMVYLVSHQSDRLSDGQIDKLIEWSQNQAPDLKLKPNLRISRQSERELRFPRTPDVPRQQTTLPSDIQYKPPEPQPRDAFSLIPAEVRDEDNPYGYVDNSTLAELIVKLDHARKDERLLQEGITLEVVSPNWLSSAGSEFGGGGGPGAQPDPYTDAIATAPYEFTLPEAINPLCPEQKNRGEGVKVAILDTAPCLHDLADAYERYRKVNPQNTKDRHLLIEELLRPNGPLHVYPASYEELLRMRSVHLRDHNYEMTDHGLFVAGIIHSIAPAAEIHLYEVLNPYGVGDLTSIAWGLWQVSESFAGQPLVVNCSWVLNIPLGEYSLDDLISPNPDRVIKKVTALPVIGHRHTDLDRTLVEKMVTDPTWLGRMGALIEWICDLLFLGGSRVIAAAGNDWKPREDKGRPQARYPAAFNSVLGIGALPKDKVSKDKTPISNAKRKTASYSNLSDQPGEVGVTTLGGESGEQQGVLGIYLGKFPSKESNMPGPKNGTDWAWWAGTSFATPVITGAIAAVLSDPDETTRPRTTEEAIAKMYAKRVIVNDQTDYKEDMLDATQG